ncbi:MAG TPA: DUF3365 domain-containing protein [Polyangiaceae bacterium]|nr:DUF3365 domain-containing protein [Polyangiaceae bacterium]
MNRSYIFVTFAFLSGACRTAPSPSGITPEQAADFVHTVLEANRAVYAEEVVHRLQDVEHVVRADEKFREEKALPLPSQMFRLAAKRVGERAAFRFALISPWAINKANMPATEFERRGMDTVANTPDAPHRAYQTVNGKRYFTALYADRAVSQACVRCHNEHAESPRKDFKLGDIMGGVVVSLPLE